MSRSLFHALLGAAAFSAATAGAALAQGLDETRPGVQPLVHPPTIVVTEEPTTTGSITTRAPAVVMPVPKAAPEADARRGCDTEKYDFGQSEVRVHRC